MVCNPYPSAIDWGDSLGDGGVPAGLLRTNVDRTIWFSIADNSFSTYNGELGQGVPGTVTRYIPAMQAFWTRVTNDGGGTLGVDNTIRLHNKLAFYKESTVSDDLFRIDVTIDTLTDEAAIGFYQNAKGVFEMYDSQKMFSTNSNSPQIYTLTTDSVQVVINSFPVLIADTERIVPLGFKTNIAGSFNFNAANISDFDPGISVFLEDVQQSILQDLRENSIYAFTSGAVNDASRFRLHFGDISTNLSNAASDNSILVYALNSTLYVNMLQNGIIELYDMLGRKIMSQTSVQGLNRLQPDVSKGIYIVKVQSNDKVINRKVYLY